MKKTSIISAKAFATTLALGLGAVLAPSLAHADLSATDGSDLTVGGLQSAAGRGEARFDWLKPNKPSGQARVASMTLHGTGSWICSPSGFGSKSKCHRR